MAKYHVHNASVNYLGNPYCGPLLKEAGIAHSEAQYGTLEDAIECANKLHDLNPSGWLVVRTFSERVVYDSRKPEAHL